MAFVPGMNSKMPTIVGWLFRIYDWKKIHVHVSGA